MMFVNIARIYYSHVTLKFIVNDFVLTIISDTRIRYFLKAQRENKKLKTPMLVNRKFYTIECVYSLIVWKQLLNQQSER